MFAATAADLNRRPENVTAAPRIYNEMQRHRRTQRMNVQNNEYELETCSE
jgi:hypothetical protein